MQRSVIELKHVGIGLPEGCPHDKDMLFAEKKCILAEMDALIK